MLLCSINISPTYICPTGVDVEVLSVSFCVVPVLSICPHAPLPSAELPHPGIWECGNTASCGLPGAHIPDTVSYEGMFNSSTEDVPGNPGPNAKKALKY